MNQKSDDNGGFVESNCSPTKMVRSNKNIGNPEIPVKKFKRSNY